MEKPQYTAEEIARKREAIRRFLNREKKTTADRPSSDPAKIKKSHRKN